MSIYQSIQEHLAVTSALLPLEATLSLVAEKMVRCLQRGGKICWMGNGGSASDSQHLAAEFVGRFELERRGLASIAFSTDTSVLTAVANDYGFDAVFERQVQALCNPEDVVVGISTSGNSENVCRALALARSEGCFTVAFTGGDGGRLIEIADTSLVVPSSTTSRIQEAHILLGHILCREVETAMVGVANQNGAYV